jgi:hypothetical protein
MRFERASYKPGKDVLVYGAVDSNAATVITRVYSPAALGSVDMTLKKLEPGVFALDFNFREVGNYIFVVEEDGTVQTVLNAKVYA